MNRFTSNLLLPLLLFLPGIGLAQTVPCATDQVTAAQYNQDPDLMERMQAESDAAYVQYLNNRQLQGEARANCDVYVVPVVFHVVHDGGASNISDAKVLSQLTQTNNHFRRMPGTIGFGDGTDTRIQLAAAGLDPNGNATNGITRHLNPGLANHTTEAPNNEYGDLINLVFWNGYLNVYIVREVNGNTIGYTFLPDAFGGSSRAIVMSHDFWGSTPPLVGSYTQGKSFSHELGHWLGLRHPFGTGGNQAGGCGGMDANNCETAGDRVCDTPQASDESFSCNNNNSCEETPCDYQDPDFLYMDYTVGNCRNVFTQGQADRMHFFLDGQLSSFVSASNLAATGVSTTPILSEPIADFEASQLTGCVGTTIVFTEETIGCVDNWNWTFPGGTPATSTDQNPSVSYAFAGTFPVLLTVSNAQHSVTISKTNYITVAPQAVSLPYSEGFESGSFPPVGWRLFDYEGDGGWERKLAIASEGAASLSFPAYNSLSCDSDDDLVSPLLDLTDKVAANFSFDFAYQYADISQDEWDLLLIEVLNECGEKQGNAIFDRQGFFLSTEGTANNNNGYIPAGTSSWDTYNGDLEDFLGEKVFLRFRFRSYQGQNFYMDNFQVNAITTALDPLADLKAATKVLPNPFTSGFKVNMTLPEAEQIRLELVDLQGRSLYVQDLGLKTAGVHEVDLSSPAISQLTAGVYFLNIQTPQGQATKKIMKM